jgi:predicted PP-loop superfamily ATPase
MIESIFDQISEIRKELGFSRGVSPRIDFVYSHDDESLHIITPDRAEKSLLLGPGGRIITELAKRVSKKVTVYGQDEILLKQHRLQLTLNRIDEIFSTVNIGQKQFLDLLRNLVTRELSFPEHTLIPVFSSNPKLKVAVAYSGGIDSSAAIFVLTQSALRPDAITVELGSEYYSPYETGKIRKWCDEIGVKQILIQPIRSVTKVIQDTEDGKIHPCGKCHAIIQDSMIKFASENQYDILVTGELLPNGRQSILFDDKILIVHLPAALALSKYRTEILAEQSGKKLGRRRFGCRLVTKANKKGWRNIGPSIFRVLRELEGGILTTGQGLEYIKDIVRPWIDERS